MENATKALLIAAAVLIAIVLISLGVSILSSSNDSSAQVSAVSNQMSSTTNEAQDAAINTISSLTTGADE